MTPREWAETCLPWVEALAADDGVDRALRLVCADWFDENYPFAEADEGRTAFFRFQAAEADNPSTLDWMLLHLGRRWRCPLCRPPLRDRACLMCGSRRWIDKPDQWGPPDVAKAALEPGGRRFTSWEVGVIGRPCRARPGESVEAVESPLRAFGFGPHSRYEYPSWAEGGGGGLMGTIWPDRTLERGDVRSHYTGIMCWGLYVLDQCGRVAGRRDHRPDYVRFGESARVGFRLAYRHEL